jgi:hypothetical protein
MAEQTRLLPEFMVGDIVNIPVPWSDEPLKVTLDKGDIVLFYASGGVQDVASNMDTAICMVNEGAIGVAMDPNNQEALDHERALYVDCFGDNS